MWFRKRGGKWHECRNPLPLGMGYRAYSHVCGFCWRSECETTGTMPPAEETCKRCRKAARK